MYHDLLMKHTESAIYGIYGIFKDPLHAIDVSGATHTITEAV